MPRSPRSQAPPLWCRACGAEILRHAETLIPVLPSSLRKGQLKFEAALREREREREQHWKTRVA